MAQSGESVPMALSADLLGLRPDTAEAAACSTGATKSGAYSKKRPAMSDITNFHSDNRNNGGEKGKATSTRGGSVKSVEVVKERAPVVRERTASRTNIMEGIPQTEFHCSPEDLDLEPMAIETTDDDVIVDIDAPDMGKHLMCPEIAHEVIEHTWRDQEKHRPAVNYMEGRQRDINANMRAILMDWLVEVAEEYRLVPDTLFLSVGYADRYLSHSSVVRGKLQLVGVTSMLIAAKFEEVYPPAVDEFVYISDNTYTREEILAMESKILKTLDFNLHMVTPRGFIRRFQKAAAPATDIKFENLSNFVLELTLLEYGFLKFYPSVIAAACVSYALHTLERPCWNNTLSYYTKHSYEDIEECVREVHAVYTKGIQPPNPADRNPLGAIREKYSRSKFHKVSTTIPAPESLPSYNPTN